MRKYGRLPCFVESVTFRTEDLFGIVIFIYSNGQCFHRRFRSRCNTGVIIVPGSAILCLTAIISDSGICIVSYLQSR